MPGENELDNRAAVSPFLAPGQEGKSMDLSDTVIGPDGVGVHIYWVTSGDFPWGVSDQHLVLNGVDNVIGSVQSYSDTYDYYSGITLTNGNDTADGQSFGDRSFSYLYGLGGNDTLSGAYYMDG